MSDTANPLFQPVLLGALDLEHRVVMAPLTRLRSRQPGDVPQQLNATYFGQRASRGGLIITEATDVAAQARGYPGAPGIYSDAQIAGWKLVTDAVHAKGGRIVLQIWHTGRVSHSSMQPAGALPVAPSAIAAPGDHMDAQGRPVPFETPRALELSEIPGIVARFRQAAVNAARPASMASRCMARMAIFSTNSCRTAPTGATTPMAARSRTAPGFCSRWSIPSATSGAAGASACASRPGAASTA